MRIKAPQWQYRRPEEIKPSSLQIIIVADYGGHRRQLDPAFMEVHSQFYRFDEKGVIREITYCPVNPFSTLETGFWIGQLALYNPHENLVIFSNTAPRGEMAWYGHKEQPLVCVLLSNKILIFAVNYGFNLSFVKDHAVGIWTVNVSNIGSQFRSRDQYPEATMRILNGDLSMLGQKLDPEKIPDVPSNRVASIDGYGNIKTTIRRGDIPEKLLQSSILRVTINGKSNFVLNTLAEGVEGVKRGREGDLCMVVGSSGGEKNPFIEFIRYFGEAAADWDLGEKLIDDLGPVLIEPYGY